ncbi:MAG: Tex family protein [Chloroflexi bacterium]|nr:Tex family protein [Chloroflexota bacterium]
MQEVHTSIIAKELTITVHQVKVVESLLSEGATIPFIARYRKEKTGSLDEVVIGKVRDRLEQLAALDKRRNTILKSLEEQNVLTDELQKAVESAETLAVLEDIYQPYRPKRRTRAMIAREKGLEPLAMLIFLQNYATNPVKEAAAFINEERGIKSEEDALSGARDIIAEWVNDTADARQMIRKFFFRNGLIQSKVIKDKEEAGIKYSDYFDREELVTRAPGHRILALFRGEKEGFLKLSIRPPEEEALRLLFKRFVKGQSAASGQVSAAVEDGYKRLMAPSIETDLRNESKERADTEAIEVFASNLRQFLLEPPLGQKAVLAIDPGYRTGCKVVCLDRQGKLLDHTTIFPTQSVKLLAEAEKTLHDLISKYSIEVIAIGNGTASRETETFIRSLSLSPSIQIVMVNESGASVYSASEIAREELPDQDVTIRGAVSIGRRLMDPLAELVKIDPKSIGVGQYQHDVEQNKLKNSLDDVIITCVNQIGVEVNTASNKLLTYISGLGPALAKNIVEYRNQNGPFKNRTELKKVPRLGPKAFEQSAGFLRIRNATNPLDSTSVHPESYHIVETIARDLKCSIEDLIKNTDIRHRISLEHYVTDTVGMPTLNDIMQELIQPGRDPRKEFHIFTFAAGISSIDQLQQGMKLPGIVTNVTNFGAFVDIGVHQDGLIHKSELADRFVTDPNEIVKANQKVTVTVLDVDKNRKRISLSMRNRSQPKSESQSNPAS